MMTRKQSYKKFPTYNNVEMKLGTQLVSYVSAKRSLIDFLIAKKSIKKLKSLIYFFII